MLNSPRTASLTLLQDHTHVPIEAVLLYVGMVDDVRRVLVDHYYLL